GGGARAAAVDVVAVGVDAPAAVLGGVRREDRVLNLEGAATAFDGPPARARAVAGDRAAHEDDGCVAPEAAAHAGAGAVLGDRDVGQAGHIVVPDPGTVAARRVSADRAVDELEGPEAPEGAAVAGRAVAIERDVHERDDPRVVVDATAARATRVARDRAAAGGRGRRSGRVGVVEVGDELVPHASALGAAR